MRDPGNKNFCCMQLNIFAVLRHVSFGERIISFERAKTNHDKVAVFQENCRNCEDCLVYRTSEINLAFISIKVSWLSQKKNSIV